MSIIILFQYYIDRISIFEICLLYLLNILHANRNHKFENVHELKTIDVFSVVFKQFIT